MFRLKNIYPFLLLLFLLSCKKDFFDSAVDIELPTHTPQLTVAAHFNNQGSAYVVDVRHSLGILDSTSIRMVEDATVQLFENKQVVGTFKYRASEWNPELLDFYFENE